MSITRMTHDFLEVLTLNLFLLHLAAFIYPHLWMLRRNAILGSNAKYNTSEKAHIIHDIIFYIESVKYVFSIYSVAMVSNGFMCFVPYESTDSTCYKNVHLFQQFQKMKLMLYRFTTQSDITEENPKSIC